MKAMVISDIHNDTERLEQILTIFQSEHYEKLFIAGDIGTRALKLLNPLSQLIVACKGNMDAYDNFEEEANFPLPNINYSYCNGKFVAITHGHLYDEYSLPVISDIIFLGHTHRSRLTISGGRIIANPGSISRPRDETSSFIRFTKEKIEIIALESKNVINKIDL